MKERIKKLSRPIRMFWLTEFVLGKKKFFYGTVISAIIIIGMIVIAVDQFGLLGLFAVILKQGLKIIIITLGKLTIKTLLLVGVKRATIDFIIIPRVKRHIFAHIFPALIARLKDSQSRILRWIGVTFAGLSAVAVVTLVFISNGWALIQTIVSFIGAKLATSFGFKTIWALAGTAWSFLVKYWVVIKTTPIGMLIQVYFLSVIIDLVAKIIPERAKRRLKPVMDFFLELFVKLERFIDKMFGWHLEEKMKKLAKWIEPPIARKKRFKVSLELALKQKKEKQKRNWQHPDAWISRFQVKDAKQQKFKEK